MRTSTWERSNEVLGLGGVGWVVSKVTAHRDVLSQWLYLLGIGELKGVARDELVYPHLSSNYLGRPEVTRRK